MQQYFSIQYYKLIDTASSKLQATVNQEGTVAYGTQESYLLNNCIIDKCKEYPELDIDLLRIQLEMFKRQFTYSTVDEAVIVMRCQVPEVRKLLSQVEIKLTPGAVMSIAFPRPEKLAMPSLLVTAPTVVE